MSNEKILNLCIKEEKEADHLESLIPRIENEIERNERVPVCVFPGPTRNKRAMMALYRSTG